MKLEAADIEGLRPLLEEVVKATIAEIETSAAKLPAGRLGYSEAESAEILGVQRHRLRDARLRGEVHARLIGKGYVYSRSELLRFLESTTTK